MDAGLITMLVILVLMICLGIWGYFNEKRNWNGGFSRKTGEPWVYFDTDSQGGRGYKTRSGECIWISWAVDKRQDS